MGEVGVAGTREEVSRDGRGRGYRYAFLRTYIYIYICILTYIGRVDKEELEVVKWIWLKDRVEYRGFPCSLMGMVCWSVF